MKIAAVLWLTIAVILLPLNVCPFNSGQPVAAVYDLETEVGGIQNAVAGSGLLSYGDANGDGLVNVLDTLAVLKHVVGLDPLEGQLLEQAKVSENEELTVQDAIYILRYIGGLIDRFPAYPWVSYLLLGLDPYSLCDAVVIVSYHRHTYDTVMVSIPRGAYVGEEFWPPEAPGEHQRHIAYTHFFGLMRNNYNYNKAGEYTVSIVEDLLGIPLHYFASANFDGFEDLVDKIGGVEINVHEDIAGSQTGQELGLEAGLQRLNGEQALFYARYRDPRVPEEGSDHSDGDRVIRGQRLLKAALQQYKSLSSGIKVIDYIWEEQVGVNLYTDMDDWEPLMLAAVLYDLNANPNMKVLPGTWHSLHPEPGYYYLDPEGCDTLLRSLGLK